MNFVGFMTPTGSHYPLPESGPRGLAAVDIDVPRSIIHSNVQFADTGPAISDDPNAACPEYWPSNGIRLYVVAGNKIIGDRWLPHPTCSTTTDDWPASSQVTQAIVANPSSAIVYVQAPPGITGSPEYLPGGVVLNPGSPWARLQPGASDTSGVNA